MIRLGTDSLQSYHNYTLRRLQGIHLSLSPERSHVRESRRPSQATRQLCHGPTRHVISLRCLRHLSIQSATRVASQIILIGSFGLRGAGRVAYESLVLLPRNVVRPMSLGHWRQSQRSRLTPSFGEENCLQFRLSFYTVLLIRRGRLHPG